MTITDTIANTYYKADDEMGHDLAIAINVEIKRLVEAGCKFIQVDEPLFARKPENALNFGIRNLEKCFEGSMIVVLKKSHIFVVAILIK